MMNNYYQRNKYVSFLETVEEGENIWVANLCFNGLFKLKKNGNDAEYVCSFEMDNMTTSIQRKLSIFIYRKQAMPVDI